MFKGLFSRFARGAVFGFGLLAAVGLVSAGYAAAIPAFTGPAGSNPIAFPSSLADLNALIGAINTNLGSYLTFNNTAAEQGEAAFTSSLTFAVKGTCGPSAGATAVQTCLTIVDSTGRVGYIPVE